MYNYSIQELEITSIISAKDEKTEVTLMSHPDAYTAKVIAHIRSEFPTKFGLPRQSGLADTEARIVFTPPYRNPDALRADGGLRHPLPLPAQRPGAVGR